MDLEIDFTLTLSIVIAVIALISPIITTLINNHHQTKLKKIDMYEEAKRKSLNDFINSASKLSGHYDNNIDNYHYSLGCLYIYFKEIPKEINDLEYKYHDDIFFTDLIKIIKVLSKQIKKK